MDVSELKKNLLETCPVLPGQESRAWSALRYQIYEKASPRSSLNWLYYPSWRGFALGGAALVLAAMMGDAVIAQLRPISFATANSQAPGIYATSFYSKTARAQVVWLNGLDPATDKPTYLDPTTVIEEHKPDAKGDPNSL